MFIRSLPEGLCSNWPLLANVFIARIAVRAKNSMLTPIDHRPNGWRLFLVLFVSAGLALNLFMRFAWPKLHKYAVGDRTNWALINGYSIEPGEAFFECIVLHHNRRAVLSPKSSRGYHHAAQKRYSAAIRAGFAVPETVAGNGFIGVALQAQSPPTH